jgi:hypothetical protein
MVLESNRVRDILLAQSVHEAPRRQAGAFPFRADSLSRLLHFEFLQRREHGGEMKPHAAGTDFDERNFPLLLPVIDTPRRRIDRTRQLWRLSNAGSFAADPVADRELPCVFALGSVVTMRQQRTWLRKSGEGHEPAALAFWRVSLYKEQLKIVSNRFDNRWLVLV